jgi:hypothetical protein
VLLISEGLAMTQLIFVNIDTLQSTMCVLHSCGTFCCRWLQELRQCPSCQGCDMGTLCCTGCKARGRLLSRAESLAWVCKKKRCAPTSNIPCWARLRTHVAHSQSRSHTQRRLRRARAGSREREVNGGHQT